MRDYLRHIKEELTKNHYVHIPGDKYRNILIYFGASIEDLNMLESGRIHDETERDTVSSMSFRQVAFHRLLIKKRSDRICFNTGAITFIKKINDKMFHKKKFRFSKMSKSKISLAGLQGVTQIQEKEICSDEGAKVFFKRSGTRKWNLPPVDYVNCSLPKAIARVNDFLQPEEHHNQSNLNTESNMTINDQIIIRTNKVDAFSEPTPEGIHQDGTELSSVTLIKRENILKGGESRFWKIEQPTGNYDSEVFGKHAINFARKLMEKRFENKGIDRTLQFSWSNCLLNRTLENAWETIIFNDREIKHEARSFVRDLGTGPCYRDVIVNFVRKPLLDGSDQRILRNNPAFWNIDESLEKVRNPTSPLKMTIVDIFPKSHLNSIVFS